MPGGRRIAARSALLSVFTMPLLILGGMLEWLVPATSTHAAGHAIGFAVLGAYPFLFLWLGAALLIARLVSRLPQTWAGAPLPAPIAALQWVLVAVALVGGIPLLTFDLAPDVSSAAVSALTASAFPVVVIGASLAQLALIGRIPHEAGPAQSWTAAAILGHTRGVRIAAAVSATACTAATAAFLLEELPRVVSGRVGDYGVVPFVLLVAVLAAGLPHSWLVAALAGLVLVAHPATGLGPAPAVLDATAIVAVAVPAAVNAIRLARIASSDESLPRWIRRHLDRADSRPHGSPRT
ncbi:hypothetical protein [Amnibacterium sp.]|uniref:hypothetical protein n=1 Tax=Amnibacterium sp. TaxID=1872496 RepID=UPI002622159F|nr:hypothetical protein [Amnibacterium sp.]